MLATQDAMATVPVKDLDRARTFYQTTLGLTPADGDEEGVLGFRAGNSRIVVYQSDFAGTNKATALTWALGDEFDRVLADLKSKGVRFEHYDLPETKREGDVHVSGEMRVAWFKDPDGNIINIGNY